MPKLLLLPKPGTPEYRKQVKKKAIFIGSMFILGLLGMSGMVILMYFEIPQSEPVILLTALLVICFGALCMLSLLSAASLLGTVSVQTYFARLKG